MGFNELHKTLSTETQGESMSGPFILCSASLTDKSKCLFDLAESPMLIAHTALLYKILKYMYRGNERLNDDTEKRKYMYRGNERPNDGAERRKACTGGNERLNDCPETGNTCTRGIRD